MSCDVPFTTARRESAMQTRKIKGDFLNTQNMRLSPHTMHTRSLFLPWKVGCFKSWISCRYRWYRSQEEFRCKAPAKKSRRRAEANQIQAEERIKIQVFRLRGQSGRHNKHMIVMAHTLVVRYDFQLDKVACNVAISHVIAMLIGNGLSALMRQNFNRHEVYVDD